MGRIKLGQQEEKQRRGAGVWPHPVGLGPVGAERLEEAGWGGRTRASWSLRGWAWCDLALAPGEQGRGQQRCGTWRWSSSSTRRNRGRRRGLEVGEGATRDLAGRRCTGTDRIWAEMGHAGVKEGRHCKSARLLFLFGNGGGCGHCSFDRGDAGVEEGTGRGCRHGEERSGAAAAWGDEEELISSWTS